MVAIPERALRIARALCELEKGLGGRCAMPECHCSEPFQAEYLDSANAVIAVDRADWLCAAVMEQCAKAMCCGCNEGVERDGVYHVYRYENGNVHRQQCGALPIHNLNRDMPQGNQEPVAWRIAWLPGSPNSTGRPGITDNKELADARYLQGAFVTPLYERPA